ncbi:MAG: enoyl-CoA hydratase/isomerase family protein [Gemmatimonadota bacterium]|nr:MAG: enoyl-CoA hydratase/isomerase family protein [Gemmatimonadota bacterium]
MPEHWKHILFEEKDGVARIILNRPPLNVLNIEMMKEINTVLEELQSKTDVKLMVLNGEGKAFSAGVDVKEHTAEKVSEMIEIFHRMFRLLNSLEPPTLAVVHGAVLGGGCELATFCDMVLASDEATFGQPEIKVGVLPPIAAVIFPHLVRRNRALELVLTGEIISAREAERIGLINRVFPHEHFQEKAEEFVSKLQSLSAPVLRLTKKAVDIGLYASVDEAISNVESVYLDQLMSLEDAHEGLSAFLNKRKPVWKNR